VLQSLAGLGDESCILDCDHRLIGKGADQLDLAPGEGLNPVMGEGDEAHRFGLAHQRHAEPGTNFADRHYRGR